jgi:hypothetical protein
VGIGVGILGAVASVLGLGSVPSTGFPVGKDVALFTLTAGRFSRSLATRFALIRKAWFVYILRPWGTGPNSSVSYLATLHNDYVAFLFERGPLGAIGWLWIVGATLWAPLRTAFLNSERRRRWRLLALCAAFLACAMNAFAHEISHFRQVWALMAFVFATVYASLAQEDRP